MSHNLRDSKEFVGRLGWESPFFPVNNKGEALRNIAGISPDSDRLFSVAIKRNVPLQFTLKNIAWILYI